MKRPILATAVCWIASPALAAMTVWTQGTAQKVQPTTPPGASTAIGLQGAKSSTEAAQIVVTAGAGGLSGVSMSASSLSDGAGHSIPASAVTLYREAFIDFTGDTAEHGTLNVPAHSPTSDGRIPDPLIPFTDPYTGAACGAPFTVPAASSQPVWVDVAIPASAAAGLYSGTITVTAAGEAAVSVPVALTVWSFTLPDMNAVTTHFTMGTEKIAFYHSGTTRCSGGNCWLEWLPRTRLIVKRYEEMAHAHRVDTGQQFVLDPNNGTQPPSSWTDYDAAVAPYMNGSYWSDGVPSGRIAVPLSPGTPWGLQTTCTQQQYTAMAAAWAQHLKAKGWFNRAVVYAADEPPVDSYPTIAQHSAWMQAADPDWKARIMDTTAPTPQNVTTLNPALGIYCVALAWYDNWGQRGTYGRDLWPSLWRQGIGLWFYESNAQDAPWPTYATNTLIGSEPRVMKWGAWYEGATGFLMWDMNCWNRQDPWGRNEDYGKSGDGVLMYPGNHDGLSAPLGSPSGVAIDGPVASYRLKAIRAGLQDWALFRAAEAAGLKEYARSQVATVYSQLGGCMWNGCPGPLNGQFYWKWDDAGIEKARANIAAAIVRVSAPYTAADAARALRFAAGAARPASDELARFDAAKAGASAGRIDLADAIRIARKAAGLEPNPGA